jgi:LysR family transcriptional regulator for bpeEF and oprC
MDRFSTWQMFVRVVELGSFTRAAKELGLGQPAVSKQIAALEADLGTQLLSRTSRGFHLTAAGLDLYNSAVRLLGDVQETESRVRGASRGPAGLVRVAMPPALGRLYIIPRLPSFFAQFPEVTVEFSVSQRRVDLIQDGVDVALRVGALSASSLTARRIGSMQMITVATPAYLAARGTPTTPGELVRHNLITGQTDGAALAWQFKSEDGPATIVPSGTIRSNDGEDLRAAVLAGLGISHGPSALFHADIQAGTLVQILGAFAPDAVPIQAVSASGRKMVHRVRVFVDFLAATFSAEPGLRNY